MRLLRPVVLLLSIITFLSFTNIASAKVIFDQTPPNNDFTGDILNTELYKSFGCSLSLNCKVGGETVYNVGVWMKKVGSPEDVLLQVVSYPDKTLAIASSSISNAVLANSISDSDYNLVWFYFPNGVVMGNQWDYNQFFQFQFASTTVHWHSSNYYSVLQHNYNDYTAPQQWCQAIRGCYSSSFYFRLDDSPDDLSAPAPTPTPAPAGNSNVLFLPGVEASRLYRGARPDEGGREKRLWEPSSNQDIYDLFLDDQGKPVPPLLPEYSVYTRDVLDEAYGTFNIYKSFLTELEKMKSNDHSIADYSAVPYDWRLSLSDILASGVKDGEKISYTANSLDPYVLSELRRLVASSQSGKVTIIAHSNGGLLAKALLKKLADNNDPLLSKIDRLVLVSVPQLGTPSAIAALLHGYNQGIPASAVPLFLSDHLARQFGNNLPSAYNFLPSQNYFTYVDTPPVTFDSALTDWTSRYGDTVHSTDRLRNFLTDTYGRVSSGDSNVAIPDSLRSNLFNQSQAVHDALDNWTVPAGIEVVEIAGWGIPSTISGINYVKSGASVKPQPQFTIDGDGTVVTPSALWANGNASTTRYWVDEGLWNKNHPVSTGFGIFGLKHPNIFEAHDLLTLINETITNSTTTSSQYISTSTPTRETNISRLIYALHSPLTLDIYDNSGHHTGISTTTGRVEEQIPGTYFTRFGEEKYIFTDTGIPTHIFMNGYATSTFTFSVSQLQGDTLIASTTFKDISTTPNTKVKLDVSDDINTVSPMSLDLNGNGQNTIITPKLNNTVTLDTIPPEAIFTFDSINQKLLISGIDDVSGTTVSTALMTSTKNLESYSSIIKDEAGNTLQIQFNQPKPSARKINISISKLIYNGLETKVSTTTLKYKWRLDKNVFSMFASYTIASSTEMETHWRPKKNMTIVISKPFDLDDNDNDDNADNRPIKTKLPGMVITNLKTQKGSVIIGY